jgi:heme exporter protein B
VSPFAALVVRDLKLVARSGAAFSTALGFYLIVVAILPLGLGPDLKLLSRIAPGVLWVGLLLSALLTLDRIFHADHEDGALEVMALGPLPLELLAAAKCLAHWLSSALPLVALAPLLGLMLNLDISGYGALAGAMLAGSPALSFLGGAAAALTIGIRRGGLLLTLLILPLYVPTLIFGVGAVDAVLLGTGAYWPSVLVLTAISLAAMVLGPLFAAMAVRAQVG